jgi:hypothetical protein
MIFSPQLTYNTEFRFAAETFWSNKVALKIFCARCAGNLEKVENHCTSRLILTTHLKRKFIVQKC